MLNLNELIAQERKKSCGANREYGYALAKDMIIMFEKERANE